MLKPILRNPDAMSPTSQLADPQVNSQTLQSPHQQDSQQLLGARQRRTKSATKIGKGSRRGANPANPGIVQQYQQF